jgi:hypothetical protein
MEEESPFHDLSKQVKEQIFLFQTAFLLLEKNSIRSWGSASAVACQEAMKSHDLLIESFQDSKTIQVLRSYGLTSGIEVVKNVTKATRSLLTPLVKTTLKGRDSALESIPVTPKKSILTQPRTRSTSSKKKEELHGPPQKAERKIPTAAEMADKKKTRKYGRFL